jgi:hypothetical protein
MNTTEHTNPTTTSESTQGEPVIVARAADVMANVKTAIHRLTSGNATDEDFLTVQHAVAGMKGIVREYESLAKEASLEYLKGGREVVSEHERYYIGNKRTTKCRDTGRALEALLIETGGDFDAVVELMASEPFKHGACRGVLGDDWEQHFIVAEVEDVKTGKAKKEIKRIDTRFEKGRK